jgi:chromosome segregation ATPase
MNQIQTAPGNGLEVLASVKKQIDMLADQCRNVVISDAQSLERAKSLAKQAKLIENYIEDKRKELTKPILDRKKAIDDLAKSLTKDLTEAVKHLREQILFYEQEQERKRLEELRRLEEEKRRKEEELKRMQMEGNIEQIEHIEKLAEIETKAAELSEKSKNLREVWTFEVVDISLVPREYLVLDETAVRRAIQNGVREIPGLKIFKKAQLVIK